MKRVVDVLKDDKSVMLVLFVPSRSIINGKTTVDTDKFDGLIYRK